MRLYFREISEKLTPPDRRISVHLNILNKEFILVGKKLSCLVRKVEAFQQCRY
jgi:hypothetical protein